MIEIKGLMELSWGRCMTDIKKRLRQFVFSGYREPKAASRPRRQDRLPGLRHGDGHWRASQDFLAHR